MDDIREAGRVLLSALMGNDGKQQAGLAALQDVLVVAFDRAPEVFLPRSGSPELIQLDRYGLQQQTVAERILPLLKGKGLSFGLFLLERLVRTRWLCGGMPLPSSPPFAVVREALMDVVRTGPIDMNGFAAVLIGRYGPEAGEVLEELLQFAAAPAVRGNCGFLPGLVWAVYQIAGLGRGVKETFLRILEDEAYICSSGEELMRELLARHDIIVPR